MRLALSILTLTALWFLASPLIFSPVPWPDATAYYHSGLSLVSWPPRWIMHSQAIFVPSYDVANFNIMPFHPFIFGIAGKLGLTKLISTHFVLKAINLLTLLGWILILWRWLETESKSFLIIIAVTFAALFDPVLRWGTLAVRTETGVGFFWPILLRELFLISRSQRFSAWKIALPLTAAAYVHFEAVYFVPGIMIALYNGNLKQWFTRLYLVGIWTIIFLSPWILYAVLHWSIFWEQMHTQFTRLSVSNEWIANPYLLFHSFFIDAGSAVSLPKLFNLGKAAFWILILLLNLYTLLSVFRKKSNPTLIGAGISFWATTLLWWTKSEIWFTTLCHMTLWTWVALFLIIEKNKPILYCSIFYAFISLASTGLQHSRTPSYYSWQTYRQWVQCIGDHIDHAESLKDKSKMIKVWQPHIPDVLSEFATWKPNYDLTRSLDFGNKTEIALDYAKKVDAIIFSTYFNVPSSSPIPHYIGNPRPEDQSILKNAHAVAFGATLAKRLETEQPGQFHMQICHIGPFWANVALRN